MLKTSFYLLVILISTANFFAVKGQNNERKKYESTEYDFSVEYPRNWSVYFPKDNSFNDERRTRNGVIILRSPVLWDEDQPNSALIYVCSQLIDKEFNDFANLSIGAITMPAEKVERIRKAKVKQIYLTTIDSY